MATRMMKLFDPGEMEEYIKRGAARRKDISGYQMELQRATDEAAMERRERAEVGATRRRGMVEAGLGERLGREQAFARPREEAETRGTEAEATASVLKLRKIRREEGLIPRTGISPEGTPFLTNLPRTEAPTVAAPTVPAATVAKPTRRKLRPSIKRRLYGYEKSTPYSSPLFGRRTHVPGILDVYRGYTNIGEWLKHFAKRGYEYAYPKVK